MDESKNLQKQEDIKKEISKYKKIFKAVSDDKKPLTEKLYNQAAFMNVTLSELQNIINLEGAVIESVNGNGFKTYNEHPAQKSYNTMIKNFNATIKTLIDLLPETQQKDDELMEFLKSGAK